MLVLLTLASLALVAALLAIPIDLRFDAAAGEDSHARLRVEWLFGWVGRDLEPGRGGRERRKLPDWEQLSPLWQPPFRDRVGLLLRRSRRWIDIDDIRGRARFGFGDPAATGMAIGLLQPLLAFFRALPRVDLHLDPDFGAAGFSGELHGGIRAVPLGLIPPALAFALSPETIRTLRRLGSRPS